VSLLNVRQSCEVLVYWIAWNHRGAFFRCDESKQQRLRWSERVCAWHVQSLLQHFGN